LQSGRQSVSRWPKRGATVRFSTAARSLLQASEGSSPQLCTEPLPALVCLSGYLLESVRQIRRSMCVSLIAIVHKTLTRLELAGHAPATDSGGADPRIDDGVMTVSDSDELLTIERVAVLQRVGLLSAVPGDRLIAVARLVEEVRVGPGVTIIERGAVEDWLFVVADGRVRVHIDTRTLVESGPGAVVGELAVLAPAPRSASVTTMEPTLLLRLRRRPFEELLDDRPEIARVVISTLARMLQAVADQGADASQA
jgi:CRP/FNR family cyclic AMP-dependent transcriptional regulator